MYPEGLTIRYNNTQLQLHGAVARDPPLNSRIIQVLVTRNKENVNETTYYGQNGLHIALKVKNVPECMIYYLGNLIWSKAYQETEENGMMPLHLACCKQNGDIVTYIFGKCNNATTLQGIDTIFLSIRHVFDMIICQQWLCTDCWIHSGILYCLKQEMVIHFHYITFCKAVLWVTNELFFLNTDDLSVSWILGNSKQLWRITTHHCMQTLQGCKHYLIVTNLWPSSCQLLWQ